MKRILLYLCLVGTSCAVLLRKPRRAGFGSKSEEMMQFGPYSYMNSPQLSQLAPFLYGYRPSYPQLFPRPLQRFYLWPQQTPVHQAARLPQRRPHQIPAARQPIHRPQQRPQVPRQPHKPIQQLPRQKIQLPPKKPPNTVPPQTHHQVPVHQPKVVRQQQPQILFPNQQHLWHFPQIFSQGGFHPQPYGPFHGHMPAGFGRPPVSNEEGTPYYGYGYGYPGFGGRPYNSEEFEQDYEKPKEKDAPNTESPAADPATNATDTNSTLSNPSSQGGNATSSGLSVTDSGANNPPNLESRLLIGNRVPTVSPTLHVPKGDAAAPNFLDPSIQRASSLNNNHMIQNLPSGKQQSMGNGLHVYKPYPDMDEPRHNPYIPRGNPSGHPENPTYPSGYGESSNQRGNLQKINNNNNNPSVNIRPNLYAQQEHPHFPERNPSDQRQTLPFPSSDPQSQWNNDPVYDGFPPEGPSVDAQFSTLGQAGNSHDTRKDTDHFQPSGMHQPSSLSPQGVFLPTKRTLSEAETHQYPWKEQGINRPVHEREQFPPPRKQVWKKQEDLQVFQDDPPRYHSRHSSGYFGQREGVFYPEKSFYDQPPRSFPPDKWEGRENPPTLGPAGQRDHPLYSSAMPSNQVQRSSYRRSNSLVQQEHDIYPRQTPWTHEKHLLDQDREYRNTPYSPSNQHAYPKYPPENPPNQRRGNAPYKEINPWIPEEHSPPYAAENLRQTDNNPYHRNNEFGHRERNFPNKGANSPPQGTTLLQGGPQYSERDTWSPPRMDPSVQKEASPYFTSYSPDFRRNPTHVEDTGDAHISKVNVAERRNYPDILGYPDNYPREHRTITLYPTANRLCCVGDSSVPRENSLAPLRSAPQFRLASWEQRGSSVYPEARGDHTKQAGHMLYPSAMRSSLKTENGPPNQRENLFGDDVVALEKTPPCSKAQLGQENGHEVNHETGSMPTRDIPCYGRSIRGDGHSILERLIQPKREYERAAVDMFVPQKGPLVQGIRSTAFNGEGRRKEQEAVLGFKRIPCFVNQLKQLLSSTGAPSGDQQQDPFHAENPAKSYVVLPEPHPLSSTDPSYDAEEKPLAPSSLGEDLAEQPSERTSDCLLLQK